MISKKKASIFSLIECYFECIVGCDTKDQICIYKCVEIIKEYDN